MSFNPAVFVVTRQSYYYSHENLVEIAQGGRDYSGSDALCKKYQGEFEEFEGMTDAVTAGIAIAKAWQADEPEEEILIGIGNTQGMGLEIEGEKLTEELEAELLKKAEEFDAKLPRCQWCNSLLPEKGKRYGHQYTMHDGGDEAYPFCSSNCADNDWARIEEELAEDEEDDEEE